MICELTDTVGDQIGGYLCLFFLLFVLFLFFVCSPPAVCLSAWLVCMLAKEPADWYLRLSDIYILN